MTITGFTLIGQQFGRLTVTSELAMGVESNGIKYRRWQCFCDCGNTLAVRTGSLRSGKARSCGCLQREMIVARNTKHGLAGRENRAPEYTIWKGMRKRCFNPDPSDAKYWKDRGITVCDRWNDFAAFYADMGPRPSPQHSIDRIDVNGNYEPNNCRWATTTEQRCNRRDYIKLHGGKA